MVWVDGLRQVKNTKMTTPMAGKKMRWKKIVNAMCRDAIYRVLCEMKHFIYLPIARRFPPGRNCHSRRVGVTMTGFLKIYLHNCLI